MINAPGGVNGRKVNLTRMTCENRSIQNWNFHL